MPRLNPILTKEERIRESVLLRERWRLIKTGLDRSSTKVRKSCIFVNGNFHSKINSDNEIQLVSGTPTEIQLVDKCSDIINSSTRMLLLTTLDLHMLNLLLAPSFLIRFVEAVFTTSNQSINHITDTPHCLATPSKSPYDYCPVKSVSSTHVV